MKIKLLILFVGLLTTVTVSAQTYFQGKVLSGTDSLPIRGAAVVIKDLPKGTFTDAKGDFRISVKSGSVLSISFLGFTTQEVIATEANNNKAIYLRFTGLQMQEVIVSNGYQEISKERAPGSYVAVDNALLNRSVSTNVIDRLADVVPGLTFNNIGVRASDQTSISIRGQSTLFAQTSPLIILDNYPFEGDVNSINPNDVENISILKDAAAASIWGARAGNGVIVITTKKGRFDQPLKVSFNSNITIGNKPDAFYTPVMSSADFVELEKTLFARGFYLSQERSTAKIALTPAVELLIAKRDGKLTAADADAQIEALKANDVRSDYKDYLYQRSINQQYALNLTGGGTNQRYYFSVGYDRNRSSAVGNGYERLTVNANNTYTTAKQKLTISTGIYLSFGQTPQNGLNMASLNYASGKPLYPYARLADSMGQPLAITHTYRNITLDAAEKSGLLNWRFVPLQEPGFADQGTGLNDYRLNTTLKYRVVNGLSASLLYQYTQNSSKYHNLQDMDSWYTRDQINRLTTVAANGLLSRPIPLGGILDIRNNTINNHNIRAQLDYDRSWKGDHRLNAIGGAELRDIHGAGTNYRYYGYDDEHASSIPVDYVNFYGSYVNPASLSNKILNNDGLSDQTDRYISYYANAAYTYKGRYVLSGSGRLDQSNLFGVRTNQKGTPLYSLGASWQISGEPFYHFKYLPTLKLRTTYGSNGNIDRTLSAYTTAIYFAASNSFLGVPYATISNPPNPDLRWERVNTWNAGVDLVSLKEIITASVDVYVKSGTDLIGNAPLAPQTGLVQFRGNTADTRTTGIDLTLGVKIIDKRMFKWNANLLYSMVNEKVTRYLLPSTNIGRDFLSGSYSSTPTEGKPLYAIYSYPWAGLDPVTGAPMGYLKGAVSQDYTGIINSSTLDNINYHGSARPTTYGALRNTLVYGPLSISANISYRLGFFVRKASVQYSPILSGLSGHGDYSLRWQKPGDENSTSVPAMPATANNNRDLFYANSSVLVAKGDHIRLQDVAISYDLNNNAFKHLPLRNLRVYFFANNLGILWKAMNGNLDPDAVNNDRIPSPKTFAIGLKADL